MSSDSETRRRLKGHPTRYELVAEHKATHRRILLAYCSGARSRGRIYHVLRGYFECLIPTFGTTTITWGERAADGLTIGDWHVYFTGRTQRGCIGREADFILDLPENVKPEPAAHAC